MSTSPVPLAVAGTLSADSTEYVPLPFDVAVVSALIAIGMAAPRPPEAPLSVLLKSRVSQPIRTERLLTPAVVQAGSFILSNKS